MDTCEWIYKFETPLQTLKQYHEDGPNKVYSDQCTIYIKPQDKTLSELFLQTLTKYTKAFFYGMEVVLLPAGDWKNLDINTYEKCYGFQLDSSDIMEKTFYKMPKDAYTYMNIVKDDLNRKGFGYDPEWRKGLTAEEDDGEDEKLDVEELQRKQAEFDLLVFRSVKVICHEICHTFCLPHCPYYECLMNGSNTIAEGRRKPLYLCPVCLRKLQSVIGFDIIERYEKLVEVINEIENPRFDDLFNWYKQRLAPLYLKAKSEFCRLPYRIEKEPKPVPQKVVKTVVKNKKPGKPGLMEEGVKKENKETRGMTAIQKLIWEKQHKKKKKAFNMKK